MSERHIKVWRREEKTPNPSPEEIATRYDQSFAIVTAQQLDRSADSSAASREATCADADRRFNDVRLS
jgi:hypothetical protein